MTIEKRRKILLKIAKDVLSDIIPAKLFGHVISPKELKKFNKIAVFGIGKAAKQMVKAILPLIGRKPDVVLMADSGHPLPTMESVANTKKMIAVARNLQEKDLAIVLISGGGSSMFTCPVPGMTLKNLIDITKALLKSGATIQEINTVRKHLCQVKGGKFAALLYPATVLGFVISDVVGNDLSSIASGPISPDKSIFEDTLRILKKYKIKNMLKIEPKTACCDTKYFKNIYIKILADHSTVAKKAQEKAKKLGLKTILIKKPITGEARVAVKTFINQAQPNSLLIASGETTVTCKGKGHGGRNQEFVLAGLKYLKENQSLLSIGTDGVDGICPEEIAGAIGDFKIIFEAKKLNLSIEKYLKNNDSYSFFNKTSGHIKTGKTGTNLGDLMLLLTT